MRIIGGNDYYDSAAAYGVDPQIIFTRNKTILSEKDSEKLNDLLNFGDSTTLVVVKSFDEKLAGWNSLLKISLGHNDEVEYTFDIMKLYFCGKVYHGIEARHKTYGYRDDGSLDDSKNEYFWNVEKFEKWLDDNGMKLIQNRTRLFRKTREDFLVAEVNADAGEYLDSLNATNAMVQTTDNGSRWVINSDGLKDLKFQKVFSPVEAFQEISMWQGRFANQGADTVVINDDKIKAHKHGMDKWSFRKMGKNSK